MSVGPWQLLIIALIVLLLFGGSRLGDIGKGLGEGIRNFKKGLGDPEEPPRQLPPKTETPKSASGEDPTRSEENKDA